MFAEERAGYDKAVSIILEIASTLGEVCGGLGSGTGTEGGVREFSVVALLFIPGLVAAALCFFCGYGFGYERGLRAGQLAAGAKCDYFFSYPGERCRLSMGHEGKHIPPVEMGFGEPAYRVFKGGHIMCFRCGQPQGAPHLVTCSGKGMV